MMNMKMQLKIQRETDMNDTHDIRELHIYNAIPKPGLLSFVLS